MTSAEKLIEATEKFQAARIAFHSAKTAKARRDADEDLQFWGSKVAFLQSAS